MTDTQAKVPPLRAWSSLALRVASFLTIAALIGGVLNHVSASLEHSARPAGFARGVVQGALMPMSFPNLLVGRDITIYSQNNTGVSYKLGYTSGVNACGALFFGFVFWRLRRFRKWANVQKHGNPAPQA
jgi:hypothetical protein